MARWVVDMFDDDDPAVRLGREALALRPTEEPESATPPPSGVTTAPDASEPVDGPLSRRARISALVARVQTGDLSAVAALRELLGG